MATNGSLTTLIKNYVDPIYSTYETEINNEISRQNTDINTFKSTVNSQIEEIDTKVTNATSGSPLVASSIDDMTETDRVYVNTTDGKWYYYDGDSWEIGGTYQSTGIGDNDVEYGNLSEFLQGVFSTDLSNTNTTTGHYIRYDGRYSDSGSYSVTDAILLKKGETIYFKGTLSNIQSAISEYFNSAYIPLVLGTSESATEGLYQYTAEKDMYIVLCFKTANAHVYFKYVSSIKLNELENIKNYTPYYTLDTGHYINTSGVYSSASPYNLTSPITLEVGEKITLKSLSMTTVSAIARANNDTTYTSLVIGTSDSAVDTYEYTNNTGSSIRVVLSYDSRKPVYINKVLTRNIFTDIYKNLESDPVVTDYNNYLMAFSNITAIGDSLTYSQVYTGVATTRQSYNPYPKVLSNIIGANYEILASSGATPVTWTASFFNNLTNTNKDNLFIIYLGTNGGLTDTLDTDAPAGTDYNTWASTNTGQYARIVAKCLDLGGKVLIIPPWVVSQSASLDTTLSVINQICERFSVTKINPINLTNPNYHYYPDKTGTNSVHLNDLGYAVFAQKVIEEVSKIDNTNLYNLILK